ncbi:MAG: PAS domain S-box protein [Syntrophothermus sp.]
MQFLKKIKQYLTSFDFESSEDNRIAGIITTIAVVIIAGLSFLLVFRLAGQQYTYLLSFGTTIALQFLSIQLVKKKNIDSASTIIIWTILFLIIGLAYSDKGIGDPAINGIPGVLIIISLVKRKKDYLIHTFLAFLFFNLLGIAEVLNYYTPGQRGGITFSDLLDLNVVFLITSALIRILSSHLLKSLKHTKLQAEQLTKSEHRYRVLLATANEGILILNPSGSITYANQKISEISGYSAGELMAMNVSDLISSDELEDHYSKLKQREMGIRANFERKMVRRNGDLIWTEVSASPILDEVGNYTGFFSMISDITARKKAEAALKEAKEKAEKMDDLKSNFLAQMSHEIRTPVNTILSFTSLIKSELESSMSEDMAEGFRIIDAGGRRLTRTIDMILTMSQLQAGSYETAAVEMNLYEDVLFGLYEEFRNPARIKNLKLEIIRRTDDLNVTADQYSVTQLFQNLIDNAVKYTKQGKIEIILYKNSEMHSCVDISDTGIGISEEYMRNIFNPFSQEETGYTRKFEGNGLGLALVKKYAEINSLNIDVKSSKNQGTTFTVTFCPPEKQDIHG